MTLTGMKAMDLTTPHRLGRRAVLVALASGIGGILWVLGDAAAPTPLAPLTPPPPPAAALLPAAWVVEPALWAGLSGLLYRLGALGMHWPGLLLALLLVAGSALAVVHPGAFQRPAPYRLPGARASIAYVSAMLIGLALPATVLLLGNLLGPTSALAVGGAMRVAIGVIVFCAFLWTLAGQDIWHPRALLRFAHGGVAGFGIVGAFALAIVLLVPFGAVADVDAVEAAIRDLGLGRPGATWGTVLGWRLLLIGLAFALAGAVAVMAGPQSVGPGPRFGAGVVAAVVLGLLLGAGWGASRAAATLTDELTPDVVSELSLTSGSQRTVVLLIGSGRTTVARRTGGNDAETLYLNRECNDMSTALPAPSDENVQRLESALAATGGAVSVRASRILACLAGLHALRFEPDRAAGVLFDEPAPGRLPLATLGAAVRGLVNRSGTPAARRWLALLADSARFAGEPEIRSRLARRLAAPAESTATVAGILGTEEPALWRVAVVRGVATGQQGSPALHAPISGGQVLQYMSAAAAPDAAGRFEVAGVGAGTWHLALLAPDGATAASIATLSVRGDPGQFSVPAASRRDLGLIRLSR